MRLAADHVTPPEEARISAGGEKAPALFGRPRMTATSAAAIRKLLLCMAVDRTCASLGDVLLSLALPGRS